MNHKTDNTMKRITDNQMGTYSSPATEITELFLEGVLCASDKMGTTETWDEIDLSGSGI